MTQFTLLPLTFTLRYYAPCVTVTPTDTECVMTTKTPSKATSQTERAFWREAFLVGPRFLETWMVPDQEIQARAEFADAAVQELRRRTTWRQP